MSRERLKYLILRILGVFRFPRQKVFTSILNRENSTGPGRFIFNLEQSLKQEKIYFERKFLGRCRFALIISSAPKSFYNYCSKKGIKTILRIDGFSLPVAYNNVEYSYKDTRVFTETRINTNFQIQMGLLKSSHVVYQSHFSKRIADKYLYNRVDNYSIIHNGVDTNHFKPIKVDKKDSTSGLTLGIFGTLRDTDIVLTGLQAFKLYKQKSKKTKLLLIGAMNEAVNLKFNEWAINNSNLINDVDVLGKTHFEELPSLLNKVDIALHLTYADACPNAVLEYLACGVPVIHLQWGGTIELVGDAGISIQHPKYEYDMDLVKKVLDAIGIIHHNLRDFSLKARNRAITNFTLEKMSNHYLEILKND